MSTKIINNIYTIFINIWILSLLATIENFASSRKDIQFLTENFISIFIAPLFDIFKFSDFYMAIYRYNFWFLYIYINSFNIIFSYDSVHISASAIAASLRRTSAARHQLNLWRIFTWLKKAIYLIACLLMKRIDIVSVEHDYYSHCSNNANNETQ